jgi:hypothetical protein
MGYHLNAERLRAEVKTFLENDRIPERRMWAKPNFLDARPVGNEPRAFQELYERARQLDQWPGDRWQEPVGYHRNPFLRQSKNTELAAIILTDPDRQQEAFDKLLEAGYKPDAAKALLIQYHETLNISEEE